MTKKIAILFVAGFGFWVGLEIGTERHWLAYLFLALPIAVLGGFVGRKVWFVFSGGKYGKKNGRRIGF